MSALWNYERYRINASSLKQDLLWPPAEQTLMDAFMPKGIIPLDYNSRTKSRKILERMAKQFRREFHYDFTQFACEEDMCSYRNPLIDGPIGLLFYKEKVAHEYFIIGGACFRWRHYKDSPAAEWALSWIWIHPYERNQGRLTVAWPILKEIFGNFFIEPPLSHAMEGFIKSINSGGILNA